MLSISTRGRYATRILVLLASDRGERSLTKHEIAASEGLTPAYVQQIMGGLQAAGLALSFRGKQGGFKLARPADTITVADVLRVMEGDIRLAPCHDGDNCDRIAGCPTRDIWVDAAFLLDDYFRQTTIAQLAEKAAVLAARGRTATPAETAVGAFVEKGARL